MLRHFTLEYWIDDGRYVGRLKEVPGVFSQGETLDELEENIRDAYQMMTADEETIHRPDAHSKEAEANQCKISKRVLIESSLCMLRMACAKSLAADTQVIFPLSITSSLSGSESVTIRLSRELLRMRSTAGPESTA